MGLSDTRRVLVTLVLLVSDDTWLVPLVLRRPLDSYVGVTLVCVLRVETTGLDVDVPPSLRRDTTVWLPSVVVLMPVLRVV